MLRVSTYNIFIPLNNEKREFIIIHGYSGAMDIVSEDICIKLKEGKTCPEILSDIEEDELEKLKDRGYVTSKSSDEEIETFKKITNAMLKSKKKKDICLTIVPTYNCNFRCTYCFEQTIHKEKKNMMEKIMSREMVDELFHSLERLKEEGYEIVPEMTLFGGEPLLNQNIEIIEYIVEKCMKNGIRLSAITNGYDIDSFGSLIEKGKIESLQITLDGMAEFHNKRRFLKGGKGTFAKITDNITMYLDKGINIDVRTNIDKTNIEQAVLLMEFYKQKGWTEYKNFNYYFKSVHACYEKEEDMIFDDTIMKKLSSKIDSWSLINMIALHLNVKEFFSLVLEESITAIHKPYFCGSSSNLITIDPFGDIYPCWETIGNKEEVIGRLQDGKIKFNSNADYWRNRNVANMIQCVKCPYALICGGGCPVHTKAFSGDIYGTYCARFKEVVNDVVPVVYKRYCEMKIKETAV